MERRVVTVRGIVQGVGFRPFVYGLASRFALHGQIRNQSGSVRIEIEGEPQSLDGFLDELIGRPPPLARIDQVSWEAGPAQGELAFSIQASEADDSLVFISPDVSTCADCLAELADPADRRWHYPFINCTNCGPRLTIIQGSPYDRRNTTMAPFAMCAACRAEYDAPTDRRFHAQPIACPECGPHLEYYQVVAGQAERARVEDPLLPFTRAIQTGQIGALKGLGGYHLVCDARREETVAELRRRKQRYEKPLAVMVGDAAAAAAICHIVRGERAQLESARRPIVLLRKRDGANVADGVAPGNPELGVMLPYTPLHHLLLREMTGGPLVMTSGNRSDEPIAYEDPDALERLRDLADVFLTHNRPIHVRCDDSVVRVIDDDVQPLRRSRGFAPEPMTLPFTMQQPALAVGGQLKATFALGRDRHAFVSHHLGDLDHYQAYRAFERDIQLYEDLFHIRPQRIACDLHPDYASTRYANERARNENCAVVPVQHHHAHLASCMAEHELHEPVIGVIFDGTGYGTDGAVWGGEFLLGDYAGFRRAGHLRYVRMPGGEQAIREPWRMALAHLVDAEVDCEPFTSRFSAQSNRLLRSMLARGIHAPRTSSVGRLFDGVAALAGVRDRVSYEGQAAMELEWLAQSETATESYPYHVAAEATNGGWVVDTRPLICSVACDVVAHVRASEIARRFHSTLVAMVVDICSRIRDATELNAVVLSGGVFMNRLLTTEAIARLRAEEFRVYRHRLVPPNDGGLSLGQLAVAAAL